jgi:hypothetical protein
MKRIVLLMLVPCAIALSQSPPGHEWLHKLSQELSEKGSALLNVHTADDGTQKYYAVSARQLAGCPEWDGNGDPPLRLSAAVELARRHLAKRHPEHDNFPFSSGRICSTGTVAYSNRWYYSLEFRVTTKSTSQVDGKSLGLLLEGDWEVPETVDIESTYVDSFEVYMMLDGSIIEPTPVKQESANNPSHHTTESRAKARLPADGER